MTIIEQIKAEIERRIKILREDEVVRQNCTSDFLEGKIYGYEEILSFLSTLEEPVCEELEKEIERIIECEKKFMNFQFKSQLIGYIARHFAQWGAEHLACVRKMIQPEKAEISFDKDYALLKEIGL